MKERKGAASLYVVIFATILFGVITLSFIRIILSESNQSSNDDLSQSAYDSALAGVEDAKIAVDRYYQCLSAGGTPDSCDPDPVYKLFKKDCEEQDGSNKIGIAGILYNGYNDGEVKLQESNSASGDNEHGIEQAYTCVIVSNVVQDYRSTLTSDTRTRVVPIGINSNNLGNISKIEFSWYSETNGTVFSKLDNDGKFPSRDGAPTPPAISLSVLATQGNFDLNTFNNDSNINFSTSILLPSSSDAPDSIKDTKLADGSYPASNTLTAINTIDSGAIIQNATAGTNNGDSYKKDPKLVYCTHGAFACTVTLEVESYLQQIAGGDLANLNGGNLMLVVSLPYGDTVTDFMVEVIDKNGQTADFNNVQISVDSTGRANQLVRRVETRLDPADVFFPYPQYALELTGDSNDALRKMFWITANCWTEKGYCNNNGVVNQ